VVVPATDEVVDADEEPLFPEASVSTKAVVTMAMTPTVRAIRA